MPLKIIIAYASAGSGHYRAAEAIYYHLKKNYPELEARIVDILEYTNFIFAKLYCRGYHLLATHLRFIWAICFHLTNLKYFSWTFNALCRLNCWRFKEMLIINQPDIILSTHFFPTDVVANLKKKHQVNSHLVTIITDFGLHALWTLGKSDRYIVASEYTHSRLITTGINREKIRVIGIPVRPNFSAKYTKDKTKDGFVGMVITGSFGWPLIEKIVDLLHSEIKLLVICGNNLRLYNRLKRKHYNNTRLFKITKDIPRLMAEADVIITKSGALTIAESLAMELPLIFIYSIPGQETVNARVLQARGCAIIPRSLRSLKDIIIDLKSNPEKIDLMRTNIRSFKNPSVTEEVCRFITEDVCTGSI